MPGLPVHLVVRTVGYTPPARVQDVLEKAQTFLHIPRSLSIHAQIYTNISPMNHLPGVHLPSSSTWLPETEFRFAHIVRLALFAGSRGFVLNPTPAGFARGIEDNAIIPNAAHIQRPGATAFPPMPRNWEASLLDHASAEC